MKRLIAKIVYIACIVFTCGSLNAQTNVWQPSRRHMQIPIWPGAVPDPQPVQAPEFVTTRLSPGGVPWLAACNVTLPTMTVYSPKGKNTGVAVVVFPGGGYQCLAMDIEGSEICDWLASRGITAVLLKYRVPVKKVGLYGESPPALEDAQRTVGLVRFHAAQWQIDQRSYPAVDAADKESCRPDFAIACYPGHLWNEDEGFKVNPNVPITATTPPTFLLQAEDDPVDNINHSLVYYIALKDAGVPVEMHLYAQGGHAFGLRHTKLPITEWPALVEKWLKTIGMTSK
jgi:acetyl esterase/lipase